MQGDLFTATTALDRIECIQLAEQAFILKGLACDQADTIIQQIYRISQQAAFRHMRTPSGHSMSVAMTNCGDYGWVTDQQGYRYTESDPLTGNHWPAMPTSFQQLATLAAKMTGFQHFSPEACLINRYDSDSRMGLHQDKDEQNLTAPIVSVSLGISAQFLFGGMNRKSQTLTMQLQHGDVVVWGGVDRLRYHGIRKLEKTIQPGLPVTGRYRYNLTFRQVM